MTLLSRAFAIVLTMLSVSILMSGCSTAEDEASSSAYSAACEGPPLRNIELRNAAQEDGYDINPRYNCIDKASFVAVHEQRAKWEAANTPAALAQVAAERAKRIADEQAHAVATAASRESAVQRSSTASAALVRCTSADGQRSVLQRGPCALDETQTQVSATSALMERSDANTGLIRCTSRDGKNVSIQRGNCANPDDYQQRLGDR